MRMVPRQSHGLAPKTIPGSPTWVYAATRARRSRCRRRRHRHSMASTLPCATRRHIRLRTFSASGNSKGALAGPKAMAPARQGGRAAAGAAGGCTRLGGRQSLMRLSWGVGMVGHCGAGSDQSLPHRATSIQRAAWSGAAAAFPPARCRRHASWGALQQQQAVTQRCSTFAHALQCAPWCAAPGLGCLPRCRQRALPAGRRRRTPCRCRRARRCPPQRPPRRRPQPVLLLQLSTITVHMSSKHPAC